MGRGLLSVVRAAWIAAACLCASFAHAGEEALQGERETRDLVRALGDANEQGRTALCAKIAASPNARWAAVTALDCVSAAEERLHKAAAEREKQGAKMFAFFVSRVVRDFESRAKFTELGTHLRALTEQSFGTNARAWRTWWDARRDGWKREEHAGSGSAEPERETYSRYFGLELRSARVLFVLDRSGSMSRWIGTGTTDSGAEFRDPDKMSVATRELTSDLDPTEGDDEVTKWQTGESDPEIGAVLESLVSNPSYKPPK